jgi:hypothetical protein
MHNVFGMERVFPFWGFERVVGAVSTSLDSFPLVLCRIAEMHLDVLSITGSAVNFAVGVVSLQTLPFLIWGHDGGVLGG